MSRIRHRRSRKLLLFGSLLLIVLIPLVIYLARTASPALADAFFGFNEGYGETVTDSANALTGTISGASWKPEEFCFFGKCLYFNGVDNFISFGDDTDLDFTATDNFTISFWFRTPTITTGTRVIVAKYNGSTGSDGGYKIYMNSDGQICFGVDDDNSWGPDDSACSTKRYDTSSWHYVSAVKTGTTRIELYIDAVQVAIDESLSATGTLVNTDAFYIGIDGDGASNPYLGYIDELKVSRKAKTTTEINADLITGSTADGTTASFGIQDQSIISDGLVGYWKMDESSGNALDSSGNGYTLTNNGSTPYVGGKFGNGIDLESTSSQYFYAAPSGNVKVAVLRESANTTTGSQDFTSSGFGTPKAALFIVTSATTNNTLADHAIWSHGATDGTSQWVVGGRSQDNVETSSTIRRGASDAVIMTLNSGDTNVDGEAAFDSWITNGVRINWNNALNSSYLVTVVLFGGNDLDAKAGNFTASGPGGTTTNVDVGFVPDSVMFFSNGTSLNDTTSTDAAHNVGFAINKSPIIQRAVGSIFYNSLSTGSSAVFMNDNRSIVNVGPGLAVSRAFEVTGFISNPVNGFTVTHRAGSSTADLISAYLALKFNDAVDTHIATVTTPNSTGNQSITSTGFTPQFIMSLTNPVSTVNDYSTNGMTGISTFTNSNEYSYALINEDGASTINTQSLSSNQAAVLPKNDGSTGYIADLISMDSDGWTWDFTNIDSVGGPDLWPYLAIEEAPQSSTHLNITSNLTLSAWIKPESNTASTQYNIVGKWDTGQEGYLLSQYGDEVRLYLDSSSNYVETNSTNLSTGTWYHVAGVYNHINKTAQIFINGVQQEINTSGTIPTSITNTGGAFHIGSANSTTTADNFYDGVIDETRVYNRALSPAEVQKLYEWAPGPVAYWKMDEGAGQYAYDISGNSNTVTLGSSTSSDSADPQWVAGKFGSALNFINNTNYATLASSIALSGDYTISFWAQPTGTDGWEGVLGGPTSSQGYINLRRDNWGGIRFDDGTGCGLNTGSSDGGWINISVVMNNSGSQFYVNGVSKGTCTSSAANFTFNQIGRFWNNTTTYGYGGNLDNIIVYNYARTPGQIVEDMNAGHPAPGSPVGSALIHYTFDEGYGTTANNKGNGGSSLNGTITSGTWTNEGQFGKALTFTASTSVTKTITDPGNINTISVWVYPTTSAASKTLITSGKLTTDSSSRPIYGGCTGTALALDTWTHIVAVSNGASSCTLYQNGKLAASGTTGVTFGTSVNLGGTSFTGRMDEFKLYNLAMSADQVKVEFNQGKATTFGANTATDGKTADNSAARDYCVPGDTSTCNPPVGEWKFDEKTGTSANDTSDNNLTGSITGATWTNGKHGGALNFNGSTDVISVADNALVDLTTDATFTAWVYPTSISGAHNIIQKDESNGYAFYLNDGQVCLWNANDTYTCAITTLTSNRWHHVAAVKSDSAIYIYQDGILVRARSATAAFPTNGLALGIGARVSDLVGAFPGKIDEVRIFNYPRSRAQIAWEMNRGQPLAWYRFEECQGTTANNVMGNAHHGTINPGSSGNTAVGTCTSGNTAHMWFDGATGKYDASLGFDGTDDTVTVADDYALRFDYSGQCFSLLAWVKRDSTGSLDTIISKEDAANDGYSLKVNADNTVSCTLNDTTLTSTHTLDTNWHHVACTINRSGTGQIYINGDKSGAAVDTSSITMATTATLTIGARSYTPAGTYFGGLIDDLRIYNYSLTEPLVRSAMNYGSTHF
jgi:hypothetical protein